MQLPCAVSPAHTRRQLQVAQDTPSAAANLAADFAAADATATAESCASSEHSHAHAQSDEGSAQMMHAPGHVGLHNQGATCYLNSLLQALYHTPEVRQRVWQWRPKQAASSSANGESSVPATDSSSAPALAPLPKRLQRSVPFQLGLLFARLALSRVRTAVSTSALTHAFGWDAGDLFRQHDVQELLRVLLTALDEQWGGGSESAAAAIPAIPSALAAPTPIPAPSSPLPPPISSLYSGTLSDTIRCLACGSVRRRRDAFQDLSLEVAGHASLQDSFRAFVRPERLERADQLRCDSAQCGGAKQDAEKCLRVSQLPPILALHLRRFVWDFDRMQRVKLNDALDVPEQIDMAEFLDAETSDSTVPSSCTPSSSSSSSTLYSLFAILMHSGVATGGHYMAFVRSAHDGVVREFNDARVFEVQGGMEAARRSARGGSGDKGGCSAYMLMYRRVEQTDEKSTAAAASDSTSPADPVDPTSNDPSLSLISPDIRNIVSAEEEAYRVEQARLELERRTLDVHAHFPNQPVLKLRLDRSTPLRSLAEQLRQHFQLDDPSIRVENTRLRRYEPALDWCGLVLDLQSDLSLNDAGFDKMTHVMLECKKPEEEWKIFVADSIPLRCALVTRDNVSHIVSESVHPSLVPSGVDVLRIEISRSQSVGELKRAVADAIAAAEQPPAWAPLGGPIRLALLHEQSCELLRDDAASLRSLELYPGRALYAESSLEEELLRPTFDRLRCQIEICFNRPLEISSASGVIGTKFVPQPEYDQKVRVSRYDTLASVKQHIGALLGLDSDSFRVSRTHTSPQLKDDSMTMAQLQLVDQSGLFVALGRPLRKDEFNISFYLLNDDTSEEKSAVADVSKDEKEAPAESNGVSASAASADSVSAASNTSTPALHSRFQFLFTLPLRGSMLVSELKAALPTFLSRLPSWRPHSSRPHLRVREKRGTAAPRVLEDARSLLDCIPTLEDGCELALQRLPQAEEWRSDLMLLSLQQWNPRASKLGPVEEVAVRKNISVGAMKRLIWSRMHPNAENATHTPPTEPGAHAADASAASAQSANGSTSPDVVAPAAQPFSPPLLLAKGKLTTRMKRADIPRLQWIGFAGTGDAEADRSVDSKLLRNALQVRSGELLLWQQPLTEDEKRSIAETKAIKKAAAEAAAATAAGTEPSSSNGSSTPAAGASKTAATSAVRKPWQRAGVVSSSSRARKPLSSSSVAVPRRPPVEHGLKIGWAPQTEEEEEAALQAALEASKLSCQPKPVKENGTEVQS